jgi:aminoglycoside 3-N-acetyltransferase
MAYIPYQAIPQQLGLKGDETLWIASDLSRLMLAAIRHENKFLPEAFLQAFEDVLPNGTLLIPGFKNTYRDNEAISFRELKPDTGGLSATAFKLYRKGEWQRTHDPLHSFFVKGKNAAAFLNRDERNTFGAGSAFGLMPELKGKFLAIDTRLQHSFTFAHYIEEKLRVPYRAFHTYRFYIDGAATPETWKVYAKKKGYDIRLDGLLPLLEQQGAAVSHTLNGVPFVLVDMNKAAFIIEKDIRENRARNLITFDWVLYLKQWIKSIR